MSHLRIPVVLMLAAVVCLCCVRSALGGTQETAGPSRTSDDSAAAKLAKLLGPGKRLRDFAPFTTERGQPAFLVLFVTDPSTEPSPDEQLPDSRPLSCPEMTEGIALGGTYHVGLIIGRRLVNEVQIPGTQDSPDSPRSTLDFPLRNTPYMNYWDWGQGTEPGEPSNVAVQPTKLIKLADYNGDGHAWEFRLVETEGGCSGVDTLLAGYSAKQRKAILYPIVTGNDLAYWRNSFFPSPNQPNAKTIHYKTYPCQFDDDPNELAEDQRFEYNQSLEAWVSTGSEFHLCVMGDPAVPSNVEVHVGSVHGHPNDTVSLPVTIGPGGHAVDGIELHLPVNNGLQLAGCTVGQAALFSDMKTSGSGIDLIFGGMSCPAVLSPHGCGGLPDSMTLLTCKVVIAEDAAPGAHELAPTGVLVSNGRDHLPATVSNGEIVVDIATPTPNP